MRVQTDYDTIIVAQYRIHKYREVQSHLRGDTDNATGMRTLHHLVKQLEPCYSPPRWQCAAQTKPAS
jgi:hypothetical protein